MFASQTIQPKKKSSGFGSYIMSNFITWKIKIVL